MNALRAVGLIVALGPLLSAASARTQSPLDELPYRDARAVQQLRYGIVVEVIDEEQWVTIRTQDAPLRPLLEELGERTGVRFFGTERIPLSVLVSADLERRSLRQVVSWILGSVGLRADRRLDTFALHVDADNRDDLLTQARTEYLRTLREFPNHPLADRTLFGQGLLEEDRGQSVAARAHYDTLVETYPESSLVDDALKRTAELFEQDRDWPMAAQKWAQLLRLEEETPYEVHAYEQLALSTALMGDAERTIHMLEALEQIAPAEDAESAQRRLYIRARGLLGQRRYSRCLEALAEADAYPRTDAQRLTSHELRAGALNGLEEFGAASRSWLAYCELAEGKDLAHGLERAAANALLAGDELAVLFIEKLAQERGLDQAVLEQAGDARQHLDLVSPRLSGQVDSERLVRAERLLAAGLTAEAAPLLADILPNIEHLEAEERARLVLAHGRALGSADVDAAIAFFRSELPALATAQQRTQVYLLAAELLEAQGRDDEAIDAYQGRL